MIIDFDGVNKALGKNERPYEVNGVKVIQDYTTFALTAARLAVDLGDEDPQVLAAFKTATEKEEDMLESFNG